MQTKESTSGDRTYRIPSHNDVPDMMMCRDPGSMRPDKTWQEGKTAMEKAIMP